MKPSKITWISFLVTLSALTIPNKAIAHNQKQVANESQAIENRLTKIAKALQAKEKQLSVDTEKPIEVAGGWVKGSRRGFVNKTGGGGFANRSGGGGFVNRRGWSDRGGFLNRR